ncbi:MAG: hypothetical protein ACTHJM_00795 [Marmoricola sp.]
MTTMTWNAFHNRGEILRSAIDAANTRQDGILPMDLPGVRDQFRDELDLLSALMLKWHARLSGAVERELMAQPMDLEHAVASAWRRASNEMPGVRLIIDQYTANPIDHTMSEAMHRAQEREWWRLAAAAGASNDESHAAARAGARVEAVARTMTDVSDIPEAEIAEAKANEVQGSFIDRIRAVLAA